MPGRKMGEELDTLSSKVFSRIGENVFAFDGSDGLFLSTMQLLKRGNLPVLVSGRFAPGRPSFMLSPIACVVETGV